MEKTIVMYKEGSTSLCPFAAAKELEHDRVDVLNGAEEFFCDFIKDEVIEKYYNKYEFSCFEIGAIALVAANIQQRHNEIKFKKLIHFCEYDQLIKLARETDNIDDVKTLLYVCQTREEHKKFFAVIKESFDHNNEIVPFFGRIKEEQEQEEEEEEDYYRNQRREQMKQKICRWGRSAFIATGIMILAASLFQLSDKALATVFVAVVAIYFVVGMVRLLCYLFYAKKDVSFLKLFIATNTKAEFDEYKQDVQKQYHIALKEAEREREIAKETTFRC